jgi:hypothetical protein
VSIIWQKLDLGRCTNNLSEVIAGDMGKIFWNDFVGKGELGHVVIFQEIAENGDLCVWSCNKTDHRDQNKLGYGVICFPQERAHRFTFCRLERPENIKNWLDYPTPL